MAYGQINADQISTSVSGYSLGAGNSSLLKNKIINGACVIDQRYGGAATANTISGYTLDRWYVNQGTTGKIIAQQNAGSVTPPAGFSNYLGLTSQSAYSISATDVFMIYQNIEGFNSADLDFGKSTAKTVTISFWVRSSLTGTFGGALGNGAASRTYPFTYTISSANTWEQKSITIAGDTTGTWIGATNGNGMRLMFGYGVGSTYSATAGSWTGGEIYGATGATSVVGTNGATFYITGVQLEVGSSATGFEYRQYGQELALCQRYYEVIGNNGDSNNRFGYIGYASSGVDTAVCGLFQVTKRAIPTLTKVGTWTVINFPQPSADGATPSTFRLIATASGTGAGKYVSDDSTKYITVSAEL